MDGLRNLHNSRQPNRERRAATGLALDRDVAPHHLTETPADRETKTCAAVFAGCGRGCLGKLLEQPAHLLRRHPDASIRNSQRNPIAAVLLSLAPIDVDGATLGKFGFQEIVSRSERKMRAIIWHRRRRGPRALADREGPQ